MPEQDRFESFDAAYDELKDGLTTAFEDGYERAIRDLKQFQDDPDKEVSKFLDTEPEAIRSSKYLGDVAYYHFEGQTLPLELFLMDQFEVLEESSDDRDLCLECGSVIRDDKDPLGEFCAECLDLFRGTGHIGKEHYNQEMNHDA